MLSALKLTARVLPGKRIEVTHPELVEGEEVEIIVLWPAPAPEATLVAPDDVPTAP